MSAIERRKADIEEKRRKVAELRRAREERSRAAAASGQPSSAGTTPRDGASLSRPSSSLADTRPGSGLATGVRTPPQSASGAPPPPPRIDDFVASILGPSSASAASASPTGSHSAKRLSSAAPENIQSPTSASESASASVAGDHAAPGDVVTSPVAPASPVPVRPAKAEAAVETSADELASRVPPAPLKVTYDKSVQTSEALWHKEQQEQAAAAARGASSGDPNLPDAVHAETPEQMRVRIIRELDEERAELERQLKHEQQRAKEDEERERARGLNDASLNAILGSASFIDFLDQSTKVVLRALTDSYDYLQDYSIAAGDDDSAAADQGKLQLVNSWYEDRWTQGRSVTALDWSPRFPELFVASYNKSSASINEPDGMAAVWNLHLKDRPEFLFHAQSDILAVQFSQFQPNIVIGGTYSGQILLWDTRSRGPNPVLKTPLSASGHTHPVYSLSLVGTQNANNLVSASTDGLVCTWALDMLARPQEMLELSRTGHAKTDEVSVTSFAFPGSETASFYVGTEEGNVYAANRYDRAGAKAGLVQNQVYQGHSGPVTGIDFHPIKGSVDLSDLFLTSGIDWTVKLWRAGGTSTAASVGETRTAPSASRREAPKVHHPVFSFESASDYVLDAKWHPEHPGIFGAVDGEGKFDVWNLTADIEVPVASAVPSPVAGLNKLAWDKRDGRKVALGSADGRVHVYECGPALTATRESDWERMRKLCKTAAPRTDAY